ALGQLLSGGLIDGVEVKGECGGPLLDPGPVDCQPVERGVQPVELGAVAGQVRVDEGPKSWPLDLEAVPAGIGDSRVVHEPAELTDAAAADDGHVGIGPGGARSERNAYRVWELAIGPALADRVQRAVIVEEQGQVARASRQEGVELRGELARARRPDRGYGGPGGVEERVDPGIDVVAPLTPSQCCDA